MFNIKSIMLQFKYRNCKKFWIYNFKIRIDNYNKFRTILKILQYSFKSSKTRQFKYNKI